MAWNEVKGEPESAKIFNSICQWGLIAGLFAKVHSLTKVKKVKTKLPKEGTPEFNALAKEGRFLLLSILWGAIIGMIWSIIDFFKHVK